jgi:putative colanic acid biosynthesis UDP-glucose lipid carrier transferase
MSIVGPRPHMLKHTDMYASMVNRYAVRLLVKPGITGLAQCKGYRGEVSKLEDIQQRVKWDIWYLENWSLLLDIKIIFITLWNMIKGDENAY